MQGVKHAAADAKEKFGNMTAKVEEKMDKSKKTDMEAPVDQTKVDNAINIADIKQDVNGDPHAAVHNDSLTHTRMTNEGLANEGNGVGAPTIPGGAVASPMGW